MQQSEKEKIKEKMSSNRLKHFTEVCNWKSISSKYFRIPIAKNTALNGLTGWRGGREGGGIASAIAVYKSLGLIFTKISKKYIFKENSFLKLIWFKYQSFLCDKSTPLERVFACVSLARELNVSVLTIP